MLTVASVLGLVAPSVFGAPDASLGFIASVPAAAVAGALVGFGTSMGSGCTSGHGLCGLPRYSNRSITAVVAFLATGMSTASVIAAVPSLIGVVRQTSPTPRVTFLPAGLVAAAVLLALEVGHRIWKHAPPAIKAVEDGATAAEAATASSSLRVDSERPGSTLTVAASSEEGCTLAAAPTVVAPGACSSGEGSRAEEGRGSGDVAAVTAATTPASQAKQDMTELARAVSFHHPHVVHSSATPGAIASAFIVGALFAGGLSLSGMTDPAKIVGFLAPNSADGWDPSLLVVLGSGLVVNGVAFPLIFRRAGPVLGQQWHLPTSKDLSAPLLLGSAVFGIGWGIAGLCPGPAMVVLGSGTEQALVFALTMLSGAYLHRVLKDTRALPHALRV